jgi:hypothetical protein
MVKFVESVPSQWLDAGHETHARQGSNLFQQATSLLGRTISEMHDAMSQSFQSQKEEKEQGPSCRITFELDTPKLVHSRGKLVT